MNILEIIPISRSTRIETLSYFTSENPAVGAIVDVPLRGKTVHGIVAAIQPAANMKADLKTAPFSLKKIEKVKARNFLSPALIAAAREEADYAGATLGATLKAMVHESIFAEADKLELECKVQNTKCKVEEKREIDNKNNQGSIINDTSEGTNDNIPPSQNVQSTPDKSASSPRTNSNTTHVLQGDDEERYGVYRSMIRQEFARKNSLLFLAPTVEEAIYIKSILEKGIEKYIFIIHHGLTAKKICETWNKAVDEKHPVVMVATGSFMAFVRSDLDTLVIERESMRGWKSQRRPYIDLRHAIETYARKTGRKLYIGDLTVRLETSRRQDQGEIEAGSLFKARSISTAHDTVIDMKQYKGRSAAGGFRIFSELAETLMKKVIEENTHMVVIAARKGLAPSTVCGDCHSIVVCNSCGAPVVLHESKGMADGESGSTYFLCHHCGERRSTEEYCKNCGSWKLGTVGIGIDLVKKKIADLFPGIKIFQLDSDSAPTSKKIKETIEKFKSTPGSILLGTELLVNYFHDKVPYAAVVTLDSLLSLPDFRISERIFYMLLRLRALTERELVIQTRKPEDKTFEFAAKGNIADFVRHSLDERKQFDWPPYSTLIKLSIEGKRDAIAAEMEKIKGFLAPVEIDIFPSFTSAARGNSLLNGLARLTQGSWPNAELLSKLRSLPPSVSVNVDPESLL
jgi:primosomal protein N'